MKALSIAYDSLEDVEVDTDLQRQQQSSGSVTTTTNLISHRGVHLILASSLAWAFGNSLNSISLLALIHPVLLVVGFCETMSFAPRVAVALTLASGAIANLIAFSTLFGYPRNSVGSCALSAGAGVCIFGMYILFALLPHFYLVKAFGSGASTLHVALPLVLPICVTTIHHVIIGETFSSFASPANALLDIQPLKNVVFLFGSTGLCFVMHLLCSCVAMMAQGKLKASIGKAYLLGVAVLLVLCSLIRLDEALYQRNVAALITPAVPVSCIFALNVHANDASYEDIWTSTKARIDAGDAIVMWSEEAVLVYNDEEEAGLVKRAQDLLAAKSTSTSSFIGLAYIKALAPGDASGFKAQNIFTLISPSGQVAWRYAKAFPVPFIESDVQPGKAVLPIHHHHTNCSVASDPLCGKTLAGAICFDMDFGGFISQAGLAKVDILLQPSWTWNAINERHFLGDAVRAAENGLSIFRCSSDGTSGIVGSKGQILSQTVTGHDPKTPILFQLQLQPHHTTLFTLVGSLFPKLCLLLFIFVLLLVACPDTVLYRLSIKRDTTAVRPFGESVDG